MLDYLYEPYWLWAFGGDMSVRLANHILNCVLYVYPSIESARKGKNAGGSGFIVGVESKYAEGRYLAYAVTNAHVVDKGSTFIRINNRDGTLDYIVKGKNDWKYHGNADLAIT